MSKTRHIGTGERGVGRSYNGPTQDQNSGMSEPTRKQETRQPLWRDLAQLAHLTGHHVCLSAFVVVREVLTFFSGRFFPLALLFSMVFILADNTNKFFFPLISLIRLLTLYFKFTPLTWLNYFIVCRSFCSSLVETTGSNHFIYKYCYF